MVFKPVASGEVVAVLHGVAARGERRKLQRERRGVGSRGSDEFENGEVVARIRARVELGSVRRAVAVGIALARTGAGTATLVMLPGATGSVGFNDGTSNSIFSGNWNIGAGVTVQTTTSPTLWTSPPVCSPLPATRSANGNCSLWGRKTSPSATQAAMEAMSFSPPWFQSPAP